MNSAGSPVSGAATCKSAARGAWLATAPGIPLAGLSVDSSWLFCSLLVEMLSGSKISSVVWLLVKSISTFTCAVKLPAPTIGETNDKILSLYIDSIFTLWANCFSVIAKFGSSSGFDNNEPYWSTTVTLSEVILGIDDDTIWTIDLICSNPKALPSASFTNTDAVGGEESLTKTDFSGIARCTLAPIMLAISFIDLASSISWVCFIFINSTDLLVPIGIFSRMS